MSITIDKSVNYSINFYVECKKNKLVINFLNVTEILIHYDFLQFYVSHV